MSAGPGALVLPRPRPDGRHSASDPVVFLHLRDNLRVRQFVRALDRYDALCRYLGAAETIPELQLGLAWPEEQKSVGLPELIDDFVVVLVETQIVPLLVFLLSAVVLRA